MVALRLETAHSRKADFLSGKGVKARTSNLLFLPNLDSLDLFKGQPVPRSIINPGGRRAGMAGDPLRDLDRAARIHVFGDTRRTETVTTNSFQDPAGLRPLLNQLQDTPTIQASPVQVFPRDSRTSLGGLARAAGLYSTTPRIISESKSNRTAARCCLCVDLLPEC
jgi:hypothetical protein